MGAVYDLGGGGGSLVDYFKKGPGGKFGFQPESFGGGKSPYSFSTSSNDVGILDLMRLGGKALVSGSENAIGTTLDAAAMWAPPEVAKPLAQAADFMGQQAAESAVSAQTEPIMQTDFWEHPVAQTVWNVSSSLPQMGASYLISSKTRNGYVGPAVAIGIPSMGSFYKEALANGVPEPKARTTSVADGFVQTMSEMIPTMHFLAGGSLMKRVVGGAIKEGLIGEGSAQLLENGLRVIGWKGTEDLANDLTQGLAESIIAGGVLGAGFGAVTPETGSADFMEQWGKVADGIVDRYAAKNYSLKPEDPATLAAKAQVKKWMYDEVAKIKDPAKLKEVLKGLKGKLEIEANSLFKGFLENTSSITTEKSPNILQNHDAKVLAKAENIGMELAGKADWPKMAPIVRELIVNHAAHLIENNVADDEVKARTQDAMEKEYLRPDRIYAYAGRDKGGEILPDLELWSPMPSNEPGKRYVGAISLKELAVKFKSSKYDPATSSWLKYSIPPADWKVWYHYIEGMPADYTKKIFDKLSNEYYNNKDHQEVLYEQTTPKAQEKAQKSFSDAVSVKLATTPSPLIQMTPLEAATEPIRQELVSKFKKKTKTQPTLKQVAKTAIPEAVGKSIIQEHEYDPSSPEFMINYFRTGEQGETSKLYPGKLSSQEGINLRLIDSTPQGDPVSGRVGTYVVSVVAGYDNALVFELGTVKSKRYVAREWREESDEPKKQDYYRGDIIKIAPPPFRDWIGKDFNSFLEEVKPFRVEAVNTKVYPLEEADARIEALRKEDEKNIQKLVEAKQRDQQPATFQNKVEAVLTSVNVIDMFTSREEMLDMLTKCRTEFPGYYPKLKEKFKMAYTEDPANEAFRQVVSGLTPEAITLAPTEAPVNPDPIDQPNEDDDTEGLHDTESLIPSAEDVYEAQDKEEHYAYSQQFEITDDILDKLTDIATLLSDYKSSLLSFVYGTEKYQKTGSAKMLKFNKAEFEREGTEQMAAEKDQKVFESLKNSYFQEIEALKAALPNGIREYINKMSIDDLYGFIASGGITENTDVQEVESFVAKHESKGNAVRYITANNPVAVQIQEGKVGDRTVTQPETIVLKGPYSYFHQEGRIRLKDKLDVLIAKADLVDLMNRTRNTKDIEWNQKINISAGGSATVYSNNPTVDQREKFVEGQNKPLSDEKVVCKEIDPKDPRQIPVKRSFQVMDFTVWVDDFILAHKNFFGEQAAERIKSKRKLGAIQMEDEILTHVMSNRRFMKYADFIANENVRPVFQKLWTISETIANDQRMLANHGQKPGKQWTQKVSDAVEFLLSLAAEEIYSVEGQPLKRSITRLGGGGIHQESDEISLDTKKRDGESRAYVEHMKLLHDFFNVPYDPNVDVQRWAQERDHLSYTTLAEKVHSDLPIISSYMKAEFEHPALQRMIKSGVLHNANIWAGMVKGWTRRVWGYAEGAQKASRSFAPSQGGEQAVNIEPQRYRTYGEFVWQTRKKGLVPQTRITASYVDYIRNSLVTAQQWKHLNLLKNWVAGNTFKLKGFESNTAVNAIINKNLGLVEYVNSKNIEQLVELTGLTPQDILTQLEYSKNPRATGFVEWSKKGFEVPYVYSPLNQVLRAFYEVDESAMGEAINNLNQKMAFLKKSLTIQPFDSTFLFMSSVLMNTAPHRWVTEMIPDYIRAVGKSKKVGEQIKKGEYYGMIDDDSRETYSNLPLFVKHGFAITSWHDMMKSLWDEKSLGKFPELNTPWENSKEYVGSAFGLNTAVFQHFIARKVYGIVDHYYNNFKKQGFSQEDAARLAVEFVQTTSFLMDPNIFGQEGKLFTLAFFTRNITVGTLKIITGAMWPALKNTPLSRLYSPPTMAYTSDGKFTYGGNLAQSFFHGTVSHSDLDVLAKFYIKHIFKIMTASVLFNAVAQYVLSFMDDDEWDEHGEVGRGNLLAKKRFTFYNEPNARFAIRLPERDVNQRRLYMQAQVIREAQHMTMMVGGMADHWTPASAPLGIMDWFRNRLNIPLSMVFNVIQNRDSQGNAIINPNIDDEYKPDAAIRYLVKELTPLGFAFRKEERAGTENKFFNAMMIPATIAGLGLKRGTPAEPGTVASEIRELKHKQATIKQFFSKDRDKLLYLGVDQFPPVSPGFSKQSRDYYIKQKLYPSKNVNEREINKQWAILQQKKKGGG